jgi:tRNA-dihydrouridine synthase B
MNTGRFASILREKKLMLPPLSGYTDYPFRMILSRFTPPFVTTEMVKARAVAEGNHRTIARLKKEEGSHMKGAQLLGCDPAVMAIAAKAVEKLGFDYTDVNMGCTVRKVASKGEGISIMKDESLACAIVKAMKNAVSIPVTVKLRTGFSFRSVNVLPLALKLAEAGADAITVHGRTGEKKFGSNVDTALIREAASTIPVPVIANGGIFTGRDAVRMLQDTGAAAVMPGRGILGNPWIVPDILSALEGRPYTPPSAAERKAVLREHFALLREFYGMRSALLKMRRIIPWYFPGCRNLKAMRGSAVKVCSPEDFEQVLDRITEDGSGFVYKNS